MAKCKECGFENPSNLKFCGNCGAKLGAIAETPKFEGLAILHITASAYLLTSLVFNALVQASLMFIVPYIVSALLGLYSDYEFYTGKISISDNHRISIHISTILDRFRDKRSNRSCMGKIYNEYYYSIERERKAIALYAE